MSAPESCCTCPTCGQHISEAHVPVGALLDIDFGTSKQRLVAALVGAYPRAVPMERLIHALYGDDEEGGPDDAESAIRSMCLQLRKALRPFGWTIPKAHPGRSDEKARRLAPLEA